MYEIAIEPNNYKDSNLTTVMFQMHNQPQNFCSLDGINKIIVIKFPSTLLQALSMAMTIPVQESSPGPAGRVLVFCQQVYHL